MRGQFECADRIVQAEVTAPPLGDDQSPGAGDSATHVENGCPGADSGTVGQLTDLVGRHEGLLPHVGRRGERGSPRRFQGRGEGRTIVLSHH